MGQEITYNIQGGFYWDWRIAVDLFLGGAGVGAFVFGVVIYEVVGTKYRRIPQTAAYLAPVLVGGGLLFLLLELGRPLHIYQTFLNVSLRSPLWWGGVFQTVFIIGAVVFAWRWRDRAADRTRRILGWALTPVACIVGAYHGMLLAMMPSRPLWNTGPTVLASLAGFVTTGIAAVMVAHLMRMKLGGRLKDGEHVERFLGDMRPARYTITVALLLQLGIFFFWWTSLRFGNLADRAAIEAANASYGSVFWSLGIGVGVVLPLVIGAASVSKLRRAARPRLHYWSVGVTSALILLGGFLFRLSVVLAGQLNPVLTTLP